MMYSKKGDKNPPMATFKYSPAEASGTSLMNPFPLARSAPSIAPNNSSKSIFFIEKTRSKSPYPTQTENFISKSNTCIGLRAVFDQPRTSNTNKNLHLRPLVTTHFPILSHQNPPVQLPAPDLNLNHPVGAHSSVMYSKIETPTRVPNMLVQSQEKSAQNGRNVTLSGSKRSEKTSCDDPCYLVNRNRMSIDRALVESANNPRKKAKISADHNPRKRVIFFIGSNDTNHTRSVHPTRDFMIYCSGCKKKLNHAKDIYIYRGEMAFCTITCRARQVYFDERMERRMTEIRALRLR